jgi:hypothetical protein
MAAETTDIGKSAREWGSTLVWAGMVGLALYGGYHLFFSGEEKKAATAIAASAPVEHATQTAEIPRAPAHFYSLRQDGEYGYEQGLSEDDQKGGVVAKPLVMFRYLGKKRGEYSIAMQDDSGARITFSCQESCDFVKTRAFVQGELVKETTTRNTPGSIMYAVLQDAVAGELEPYRQPKPDQADADH